MIGDGINDAPALI